MQCITTRKATSERNGRKTTKKWMMKHHKNDKSDNAQTADCYLSEDEDDETMTVKIERGWGYRSI